jgi:hypothetical protein
MRRLNELILASAAVCALAGAAVAADTGSTAPGSAEPTSASAKPNANDPTPPTAHERKGSRDRGLISLPLTTVPSTSPSKLESPRGIVSQPGVSQVVLVKKKAPQTRTTHTATLAKSKPVASATGHKVVVTKKPTFTAADLEPRDIKPAAYDTTSQSIVKVWLNKPGTTPRYRSGEKMEINVSASKDCNLMIFDFDGRGKLTQLFPNQFQQASSVKAGETVAIGGDNSSFDYTAALQKGREQSDERIFVYAYPLNESGNAPISVAMNPTTSAFRSAEITLEQYRKLVNESKVFFARDVQITPKSGVAVASAETTQAPNKYEVGFVIEK